MKKSLLLPAVATIFSMVSVQGFASSSFSYNKKSLSEFQYNERQEEITKHLEELDIQVLDLIRKIEFSYGNNNLENSVRYNIEVKGKYTYQKELIKILNNDKIFNDFVSSNDINTLKNVAIKYDLYFLFMYVYKYRGACVSLNELSKNFVGRKIESKDSLSFKSIKSSTGGNDGLTIKNTGGSAKVEQLFNALKLKSKYTKYQQIFGFKYN